MSTVPKGEGSQPPSRAPSPGNCPPLADQALAPDRCVFICVAKTAGFKIVRVPGSVCAPQGRSSEQEHRLAGVGGKSHLHSGRRASRNSPKFPKARPQVSEKFALLHRGKFSVQNAGAGRVPTPAGISPPSLGHPTRLCRDRPQSGSARLPLEDRSSILPPAEEGSVDSPGRWKRR